MILQGFFSQLQVGSPVTFGGLTMLPLIGPDAITVPYLTLDEALAAGVARVSEVSDAGSVPELRVENSGAQDVLLVDGEELLGAKQNRVLNLTILVAAASRTVVPVSCVEAGRWHRRSAGFSTAGRAQFAAGRAKRVARVTETLSAGGSRRGDQSEVWADIAGKADRMRTHSDTGAMADMFDQHGRTLDAYVGRFEAAERQVGAVFGIGSAARGVEVFDRTATFRAMLPKIVRSYAIDAAEQDVTVEAHAPETAGQPRHRRTPRLSTVNALAFLARIGSADVSRYPAVGKGTDVRLHGPGLAGAALMIGESVVHLTAFVLEP